MCVLHLIRAVFLTCAALSLTAVQSADFMGLGGLPYGAGEGSLAYGVSADGAVVVGHAVTWGGIVAFRWTAAGGMEDLGTLPGGSSSEAYGVSADGTVVVGQAYNGGGNIEAFRWTEADGMVGLGFLPGGNWQSSAHGVSDDGAVIVGHSGVQTLRKAIRWTEADGMEFLGYLPGDTFSSATGVSADGAVVVGWSQSISGPRQAFRSTEADGMVGLDFLPGGFNYSEAHDISADGAVIVGSSNSDIGIQAFRWTEADGMVGLGILPGGSDCAAHGVSADGTVVVGSCYITHKGDDEAFRWTEVGGMESIHALLSSSGIDMTGWVLKKAWDVTNVGTLVVGEGVDPDGHAEAWIADLSHVLPSMDISGSVKTTYTADVCAMILAGGKHMFSCNPPGEFSLTNIPRESNGTVKRQIYADGFFQKIDILTEDSDEVVVMTHSGNCPNYNSPFDPGFFPDAAGDKIDISGTVLLQDTQTLVCAMVLANGKYMFSCDDTGSYALNIPLDANGQFKLQVYADGFAPTIQTFDEFKTTNDVRMARASECQ